MKIVVDVPDEEYESYALAITFGMGSTAIRRILDGTPLPEGAEILTAEAYSDLCLRASRIPCYLESPCEYQNEDIKIPKCEYIEWHPYPQEKPTREGEYYLVTALRGGEHQVCTAWWIDESYRFGVFTDRVEAWAELPKPYEEGAE